MRLVEVVTATGVVVGEWTGDAEQGAALLAAPREGRAWVETADAVRPGVQIWDGEAFVDPPAGGRWLTRTALIRLLTDSEYVLLFKTAPASNAQMARGAALVEATNPLDLDDPLVDVLLGACVAGNFMTPQRAAELLALMRAAATP